MNAGDESGMTRGTTIAEALRAAGVRLRAAGVEEPRRTAGSLLAHALGRDRTYLITHDDEPLSDDAAGRFRALVVRRAAGEPLQYLTGRQEFYGLEFEVTPDVLIPRPETELLVETALALLAETPAPVVCDVGTGSGCVAVALLHEREDARACGLDISTAALRVAARNAERHGVLSRLRLAVSDCFSLWADDAAPPRFDLVVSNPPYVAEEEIQTLQREVRDHEPRHALTPGGDGLSIIEHLLRETPRHLKPGGHLAFEIGHGQRDRVARLVDPRVWTPLGTRPDLQGIPRTFVLRLREGPS